jgi:predicted Zn-dependent protease
VGAFANSAGQTATGQTSEAGMDGIARLDGSDGVARLATVRLSDIDGAVLGARAMAKARAGTEPVELPPGRYEVVLEPAAVGDLLENLSFYGFNGKALVERRSFVHFGEQQFDPSVTLVDAGPDADSPGQPYDAEGTPKRRLMLVDGGVTLAVAHDRRTAARAGTQSTGHALPGGGSWGPIPTNLHLVPGKPTTGSDDAVTEVDGPVADSSVADLLSRVEHGILVTDFWYTRVLDPMTLVITGLTRNGVWLIEHGQVTTPVRNFRFTQSYPQALSPGAVRGVGAHATPLPGILATATACAPALHLASWNFTGGASG